MVKFYQDFKRQKELPEFRVTNDDAGKRTDVFVSQQFPEYARSALRGLFEKGLVLVNGEMEEPGDKVKNGDIVSIDTRSLTAMPDDIEIPVIYEDDDVVVMDKPAGILTHSKGAINNEATVASFLKKKITDSNLVSNRAGIVHRLDRATSGVIVGAKNADALAKLQKQFSQRKTKKTYLAIVEGVPEIKEAVIDAPILRNPKKPQTFKIDRAGKPSQTHYKVVKEIKRDEQKYSLLELSPATGRTHQLRVHMAYVGHPIVGDIVYGNGSKSLLLHAKSLELTLPNGERKQFESKVPSRIEKFAK
jgi:23S rRNA pseudouridine1911/1915/1917 synthase